MLRESPQNSLSSDMLNCPGVGGSLIKYVNVQYGAVKLFIPLLIPHAWTATVWCITEENGNWQTTFSLVAGHTDSINRKTHHGF